jgi:hypothetical protein
LCGVENQLGGADGKILGRGTAVSSGDFERDAGCGASLDTDSIGEVEETEERFDAVVAVVLPCQHPQ